MGKKKTVVAAILAFCILGLGAYYFLPATFYRPRPAAETFAQQVADARDANAAGLSPDAAQAASQTAAADFANTYQGTGFSLGYPDSLKVGATDAADTGGSTVLLQNAAEHVGIQISIAPSDLSAVTQEAVQQDLPQIQAHGFEQVSLDGAPGLAFAATDPNFGDSLQVWLVHGRQLYQISTYATQGALLSKVLGTWKWKI